MKDKIELFYFIMEPRQTRGKGNGGGRASSPIVFPFTCSMTARGAWEDFYEAYQKGESFNDFVRKYEKNGYHYTQMRCEHIVLSHKKLRKEIYPPTPAVKEEQR